uniref:Uncharacterized protein n=1 Tax=Clytia hemisphaerica TaxID=252671 RepID=A0A7M5X3D2_9CNID
VSKIQSIERRLRALEEDNKLLRKTIIDIIIDNGKLGENDFRNQRHVIDTNTERDVDSVDFENFNILSGDTTLRHYERLQTTSSSKIEVENHEEYGETEDQVIEKKASLFVAVVFIPGCFCLFFLCLNCPLVRLCSCIQKNIIGYEKTFSINKNDTVQGPGNYQKPPMKRTISFYKLLCYLMARKRSGGRSTNIEAV